MKRVKITIILVLLFTISASIVELNERPEREYSTATYRKRYSSLSELVKDTEVDVIVRGEVVKQMSYIYNTYGKIDYVKTNHTIKVIETYKGDLKAVIQLHQTGGTVGESTMVMNENPVLEVGEEVVLFLHEYAPNEYYMVCGPQGRFSVSEKSVYSYGEFSDNQAAKSLSEKLETKGLSLTQFAKITKDAFNESK